jgi:hypothetical protein
MIVVFGFKFMRREKVDTHESANLGFCYTLVDF